MLQFIILPPLNIKNNKTMEQFDIKNVYFEWREMKKFMVKESTMATYTCNAEKHILPAFGNLQRIDEHLMQDFVVKLTEEGLSPRTVKDIMLVLKMLMSYGQKKGWTEWRDWDVKMPKLTGSDKVMVLTHGQQRLLMKYLRRHFSFRGLGLYICLCTGLRIGEVCALKWGDINIRSKVISVERTIERIYVTDGGKRRTKVVIGQPKTDSARREIPISRELAAVLKPLSSMVNDEDYVLSNGSKPLEPRLYRRYYQNLMQELGLPPMKFHGLRHTFATRCVESRCDYKTVSSILGHANIGTTLNLYVHPDMAQKRKCIDRMMKNVMR